MALLEEEKKKSRKSYLRRMAKGKGRGKGSGLGDSRGQYSKYGDINPKDVHEGDAYFRGAFVSDDPSTNINHYRGNVHRGEGKAYFRFQGKLYQITNASGTEHQEVQV
jgi:hypothetical protein